MLVQLTANLIIPVVISVYEDRSFTFITKTPPAAVLLKSCKKSKKVQVNQTKTKTVATVSAIK